MNCPKCLTNLIVKNGLRDKVQSYLCKECGFQFTKEQTGKSILHKRLAIELYLEGLSLRQIGEIIGADHSTVYHWLHEFGELLDNVRNTKKCNIIEPDKNNNTLLINNRTLVIDADNGTSFFIQKIEQKLELFQEK